MMAKLVERLKDATRSGVYRTSNSGAVLDAVQASGLDYARIEFRGRPLFDAIAEALSFPDWFGRNWDALEDCLTDLAWREASGHVLVFLDFPHGAALDELFDVLRSAAQHWASRQRAFFAVFIDPARRLSLPDLYRER
jgi:hypothetical protein